MPIRRIQPDEGSAFRAIRLQAIQDSPMAFGSTLAETEARTPEYWAGRAKSGSAGEENVIFVAEDVERWVGVASGFVDDSAATRRVDLVSMWVNPTYRGRGLGRRLVESVVTWARERGAKQVVLWVTASNDAAISLYRRYGFRDTGETQPLPSHPGTLERQMVLDLD